MVQSLPPCALSLGADELPHGATAPAAPIQGALYFASMQDHEIWREERTIGSSLLQSQQHAPYAITIQAHPEYSDRAVGFQTTFCNILSKFEERNAVPSSVLEHTRNTVMEAFDTIEQDSIRFMVAVGRTLGWLLPP